MAAVTAALFFPTWGKVLFYRDLLRWTFPGIFFLKQSLLAGEWPLWCPDLNLGYPFLAEMANAVLYPLSLVYLLFSVPAAMKVYPAVHYALTGYLMWRLLREWGLGQAAGLFGGLVWMASGYLVSMHLNFNYLIPAAWYPGLLFCFLRLLRTYQIRWLVLTNFCWALFFLGGDPQAFLWAGVLLLLYGVLALPDLTQPARKTLALLMPAGGITFLLVLAQFLPSLEFGAWCTKLQGFDFKEATTWSLHPLRLLEWIWPRVWGTLFPPEHFWGIFLGPYNLSLWAGAVYLGLFPLFLGLAQCRRFREKPTGFLLLTFFLFLLLALGSSSPLFRLVWALFPTYRIFRYPEKHLAIATFALAGLAAMGFQRLKSPGKETALPSFFRVWAILTGILAAVFLVMLAASGPLAQMMADYLRQADHYAFAPRMIRASWLEASARTAGIALAFLFVLWLGKRHPRQGRAWAGMLLLMTALDLLALGRTYLMPADPSLYTFPPEAGRLIREQQGDGGHHSDGVPKEQFRLYQTATAVYPGYMNEPLGPLDPEEWMEWNRDTLLPNLALPEGLEEVFGFDPAEFIRIARFKNTPFRAETFQMLNVKYLVKAKVTCRFPQDPDLNMLCNDLDHDLQVTRNEGYFPRAFLVDGIVAARDDAQFLKLLASTDFRKDVILLRPDFEARSGQTFLPAPVPSYRNREVVVEINNPVPGFLVLSDTYFPGWEAELDGQPTRILRANYLVRAVALEPGEHRIVFTYRPWPWRIGRDVSLVSLGLIPLLLFMRKARPVFSR